MNQLISKDSLTDLDNKVFQRVHNIKTIAICQEQLKSLTAMVTDNNNFIKSEKAKVEEAKAEAVKLAFGDYLDQYLNILRTLEDEQKSFQADILALKKEHFRDEVKKTFDLLNDGGEDGEVFDFDSFYDEKWYGKKKDDVLEAVHGKLRKLRNRNKSVTATFIVTGTEENVQRARDLLKTISAEVEEL